MIVVPYLDRYGNPPDDGPDPDTNADDLRRARAAEIGAALAHQQIREAVAASDDPVAIAPHAQGAIAEARRQAMADAGTPNAQGLLADVLDHREGVLNGELAAHVDRAVRDADITNAQARVDAARNDAGSAITPQGLHTNLATLSIAHDQLGALTNADPAAMQAAKARDTSAVHAAQVQNHLDRGDVPGALAYHQSTQGLMSGVDNAQAKAALAGPIGQMESDNRVDAHMGAETKNGPAAFSYADPTHGAGQSPVPGDTGVTIPAEAGTPVYPTGQGVATTIGPDSVTVTHPDGSSSSYGNLDKLAVKDGDPVTPDTVLGGVATAGQGATAALNYAQTQDGAPVDPASVAQQVSQPAGQYDLQAITDAINNHPDANYTNDQRVKDIATVAGRTQVAVDQAASALRTSPSTLTGGANPAASNLAMYGDRLIQSPFTSVESGALRPTDADFDPAPDAPAAPSVDQRNTPPGHVDGQSQSGRQLPRPGRQRDGSYIVSTAPGTEVASIKSGYTWQHVIGDGQCVTATKHFSGISAPTAQWRPGAAVAGNSSIPIGTAIATFGGNGGRFDNNLNQNSGIYMGQGPNGSIYILDQWPADPIRGTPAHPPAIRLMRFHEPNHPDGRPNLSNSAEAYHVILVP